MYEIANNAGNSSHHSEFGSKRTLPVMQCFRPCPQTTLDKNSCIKKYAWCKHDIKTLHTTHNHRSFLTLRKAIPQFSLFKYCSLFFTHPYPSPSMQPFRTLVIFNPYFFFFLLHTSYMHRATPQETQSFFCLSFNPFHRDLSFYIPYCNPFLFYLGLFCICLYMDVKEKKIFTPFCPPVMS